MASGLTALMRPALGLASRPALGWAALVLFALVVASFHAGRYPARGWPGAFWHYEKKGSDIEVPQRHARQASFREILGWWIGPWISEEEGVPDTRHYRPLTSTLFYLQYRLWGERDDLYCWLSLLLHLTNVVLVALLTAHLAGGPLWARLGLGGGAVVLFGSPWLANDTVISWELTWWPAQMDLGSLAFSLLSLILVKHFLHTGEHRWLYAAVAAFSVAVLFKEIAYVVAPMACLLALEARARWRPVAAAYGIALALLIGARLLALSGSLNTGAHFTGWPRYFALIAAPQVALLLIIKGMWPQLAGAILGVVAFVLLARTRIRLWAAAAAGALPTLAGTCFAVGHMLILFDTTALRTLLNLMTWLTAAALAIRAWRRPAVAALTVGFLLTALVVGWYPYIYAYRRYWVLALQSALVALLVAEGWDFVRSMKEWRRTVKPGEVASG
ncbi:MAG: hypothetical protein HY320_08470 [Armatimonadetes bacterium]|nr:hypothetical protein [Armatimonadota bacterium]